MQRPALVLTLIALAGRPARVRAIAWGWPFAATGGARGRAHRGGRGFPAGPAPAAESDPNNRRSFPSGHAALAFAAATSYTVVAGGERLPHRTRNAVLLYAGAVGIAALRVAGGKHFPTDVAGGAALGAGIGWLVGAIHATVP